MRQIVRQTALLLISCFLLFNFAEPANISISGNWSRIIDASDLQSGPGSDFNPAIESATDQIVMGITGAGGRSWRVDVSRIDTNWHANFVLSIRRTNGGTGGPGSVSGGLTYLEILPTNQTFVTGQSNRTGITFQERLEGLSVSIPPGTYTTTVRFTVTEL